MGGGGRGEGGCLIALEQYVRLMWGFLFIALK